MKIPNIKCKIEMFCSINPSEDPEKIRKSISNISPSSKIIIENFSIKAHSTDLQSLERIYETIHLKQSQKVYGRNLEKNIQADTTWFYLNKQAAFVEKIIICEEAAESPLGPIKVILQSSNIYDLIDWLVFENRKN